MPVLLPEMRPEVGWLCPHGAKPKPISSHRAGWDMRVPPPETEKRDSGCLQCGLHWSMNPTPRPALLQSTEVPAHYIVLPAQFPKDLLAGAENLPVDCWLTATTATPFLQKPECWEGKTVIPKPSVGIRYNLYYFHYQK